MRSFCGMHGNVEQPILGKVGLKAALGHLQQQFIDGQV